MSRGKKGKKCIRCGNEFLPNQGLGFICQNCTEHIPPASVDETSEIKRSHNSALRNTNLFNVFDYHGNFDDHDGIVENISTFLNSKQIIKPCIVKFQFGFEYKRSNMDIKEDKRAPIYYVPLTMELPMEVEKSQYDNVFEMAENAARNVLTLESGMELGHLVAVSFTVLQNNLLEIKGGKFTDLPAFLDKTNNIINVKNSDEKCFLWSLLANDYLKINETVLKQTLDRKGKLLFKMIERNYFSTQFKRFFLGVKKVDLYKK